VFRAQSKLRCFVAMKTVQIRRLFCQDLAHPVFRSRRQHPTEMFVYATDGADRIASELDIREIKNAFRREVISFANEFCECRGPVAYCFRADLYRIDGIAKHASQNRDQTGDGGDGLERSAMRLQKKRIRLGREQRR
jgi:hypothetical protein